MAAPAEVQQLEMSPRIRRLRERMPALADTPIRRAKLWADAVLYGAVGLFGPRRDAADAGEGP